MCLLFQFWLVPLSCMLTNDGSIDMNVLPSFMNVFIKALCFFIWSFMILIDSVYEFDLKLIDCRSSLT